jgi:hypothetical protein
MVYIMSYDRRYINMGFRHVEWSIESHTHISTSQVDGHGQWENYWFFGMNCWCGEIYFTITPTIIKFRRIKYALLERWLNPDGIWGSEDCLPRLSFGQTVYSLTKSQKGFRGLNIRHERSHWKKPDLNLAK